MKRRGQINYRISFFSVSYPHAVAEYRVQRWTRLGRSDTLYIEVFYSIVDATLTKSQGRLNEHHITTRSARLVGFVGFRNTWHLQVPLFYFLGWGTALS